jgi:hypothetical protein
MSVFVVIGALTSPRRAGAGVADGVPLLKGTAKAKVLWTTGGFTTNSNVSALFGCTSTERAGGKSIIWGVEFFEDNAAVNDVTLSQGVVTAPPGATFFVANRDTSLFLEDSTIAQEVSFASARILSTSSKLVCTGYLVDRINNPPTMIMMLPLFKKGKQGGQ